MNITQSRRPLANGPSRVARARLCIRNANLSMSSLAYERFKANITSRDNINSLLRLWVEEWSKLIGSKCIRPQNYRRNLSWFFKVGIQLVKLLTLTITVLVPHGGCFRSISTCCTFSGSDWTIQA